MLGLAALEELVLLDRQAATIRHLASQVHHITTHYRTSHS